MRTRAFHLAPIALSTLGASALAGGGNQPPTCDAGGPYLLECNGAVTTVQLDATGSFDPDQDPLTYLWVENCPFASIDDPTSPTPVLSLDLGGMCQRECGGIQLQVSDSQATSTCTTAVFASDTQGPMLVLPADVLELWTVGYPDQTDPILNPSVGMAQATDVCDPNPTVSFSDVVVPGVPPSGIETVITRTWTAVDACGHPTSGVQTITLVGPSFFSDFRLDLLPDRCPNDMTPLDGRGGLLTALVLGGADADVRTLDPVGFALARTDGTPGSVAPFRVRLADARGVPPTGNCGQPGADGYTDLVLRFRMDEVTQVLGLVQEAAPGGHDVVLRLIGRRLDGTPVECRDSLVMHLP